MAAGHARVEFEMGLDVLHCPRCGLLIFDDDHGWEQSCCSHVRFVQDWAGELWVSSEGRLPESVRARLGDRQIGDGHDFRWIESVARDLPKNCLLITLVEPVSTSGSPPAALTVALDFG